MILKITEKQIACIKRNKSLIDNKERGNDLDRIDLTALNRYDASKLIGGLISLAKCNQYLWKTGRPVSNSPYFINAIDDIFDTIEKYK